MVNPDVNLSIPNTFIGINAVEKIGEVVKGFRPKKILILTDKPIIQSGLLDKVKGQLDKGKFKYDVYDGCKADPPMTLIQELGQKIKDAKYDLLIGVGGGSNMDVTKVVSLLPLNEGVTVRDLVNGKSVPKTLPKILVPTTAGTGAEWSSVAIVSDTDDQKRAIHTDKNLPNAVIIDPELMRRMPPGLTAATGMDALVHCIEAYTSCAANIVSDMFAATAIELISKNIRRAYAKGDLDMEARYNMAIAAPMAMRAASLSGTSIAHFLSEPVQKRVHMPHGHACTMMMPYAMEFGLIGNLARFAKVAEIMGENIVGLSTYDAARKSIDAVKQLMIDFKMPRSLAEVGIKESDIDGMVQEMHDDKEFLISIWNPRNITREESKQLYLKAMKGW